MIFYRTPAGAWAGTQAEARELCRAEGAHPGAWREVDVPTSKPELLAWLRAQEPLRDDFTAPVPAPMPVPGSNIVLKEGETAPQHDAYMQRVRHDIDVEEAIQAADLPRIIALSHQIFHRLNEHVVAAEHGRRA